ncbi:MAG: hypothetical protein AABW90_01155 [Nanoarchaeota archaeon]
MTDFKFEKYLRRLKTKEQIPYLFDENLFKKTKGSNYIGRIDGILTKIIFRRGTCCSIYAETQENLKKVYDKTIERLIEEV